MNDSARAIPASAVDVRLYGSRSKVDEIVKLLAEIGFDIREDESYAGLSPTEVALYATVYPRQLYPRRWLPNPQEGGR
ncbi:hypothetical protein [Nocardia sp. NPDC052566]|uniref:hypothetical protein n=1 Tax=Nocardia sp. NPDC052566 TaxID=3364330 RepID=UPI0037C52960